MITLQHLAADRAMSVDPIDAFTLLAWSLAYQFKSCQIDLHSAVDWLQERAEIWGLDTDVAQAIMSRELAAVRE